MPLQPTESDRFLSRIPGQSNFACCCPSIGLIRLALSVCKPCPVPRACRARAPAVSGDALLWHCAIVDPFPSIYTCDSTRCTYTYAALPRSHQPTTRPFYGHASTVESGFQEDDFDEDDELEYDEEECIEVVDETDFEFGE